MITEHYLERDGERLLLRLLVDNSAALDVLTDQDAIRQAIEMLQRSDAGFQEHRLGSFGPFNVVVSTLSQGRVAIAVDGPHLGSAFRGDQSMVLYLDRDELLGVLSEQ